ncbi:MAG: TfoX/Sxy family protein [Candidatus Devosia phytovorans]|uniref:TfoX/Sxy family protein n=1 Tax=Candidatus Devosia phytovorans TaxID=3121372 RepID=A0AAJ5VTZ5_9HYPH|nr:TfoX/Sxy family protein [Devosia sp.]WEK04754.1 MAG: TfoX/Sxy family protein [Devosia sp.]
MSSQQSTIDYILEQSAGAGTMTAKKMFGEYGLYCGGKVMAFVADDKLFIKPTEAGRAYLGEVTEAPAYPGSKMYFLIDGERWDDAEWLAGLVKATADDLPVPKPKKTKV